MSAAFNHALLERLATSDGWEVALHDNRPWDGPEDRTSDWWLVDVSGYLGGRYREGIRISVHGRGPTVEAAEAEVIRYLRMAGWSEPERVEQTEIGL